jgi:alanine dehydrogenase
MGDHGGCKELIKSDEGFRGGVYIYNGTLTNEVLGKVFDLKYKNIELLLLGI